MNELPVKQSGTIAFIAAKHSIPTIIKDIQIKGSDPLGGEENQILTLIEFIIMKVSFLNSSLFLFGLTLFTACNSGETKQNATEQTVTKQDSTEQTETKQEVAGVTYTCPMHPEVTSNEPGKCPQCGMNLEKVTAKAPEHEAGEQH